MKYIKLQIFIRHLECESGNCSSKNCRKHNSRSFWISL